MTHLNTFNFDQMVSEKKGKPVTTSLKVAKYFSKTHASVLKAIRALDCSKEFREVNFDLANYIDEQGKPRPMHIMTKNGFMFLVMGFTGKKAATIKEAYINAFDWMHEQLNNISKSYMELLQL